MPLQVDQCCCGCTLKTGTILIAAYYIVTSSVVMAVSILGLSATKNTHNNSAHVTNNSDARFNRTEVVYTEHMVAGATTMFTMYAISSAISIFLNAMLLLGAQKENIRLIYVWIVAHVVYLVMSVVSLMTNMFISLLNPGERAGSVGTTLMNIVLTFYFLVVVGSFYQLLKDRQMGTLPQGAPPLVVYIDQQAAAAPPPYSELYPPWPQQQPPPPPPQPQPQQYQQQHIAK